MVMCCWYSIIVAVECCVFLSSDLKKPFTSGHTLRLRSSSSRRCETSPGIVVVFWEKNSGKNANSSKVVDICWEEPLFGGMEMKTSEDVKNANVSLPIQFSSRNSKLGLSRAETVTWHDLTWLVIANVAVKKCSTQRKLHMKRQIFFL